MIGPASAAAAVNIELGVWASTPAKHCSGSVGGAATEGSRCRHPAVVRQPGVGYIGTDLNMPWTMLSECLSLLSLPLVLL